jgi:HK97 family phage major capsid protein
VPTATIDQLVAQVRQSISDKLTTRATHVATIDDVRSLCLAEQRQPTDDEATKVRTAREAATAIDTEVEQLRATETEYLDEKKRDDAAAALSREFKPTGAGKPAYDKVGRVGQEPRTYTREKATRGEAKFFSDAWNAQRGGGAARDRIERHAREVEVNGEMTERALNTGGVAGLVVPQYLIDLAAPVLRAGRPLANIVNRHQLPESGMSLIIPRGTTGASTAVQATENSAVSSTDEVWANVTVPVTSIAGQQPVSRQTLERGEGVDEIIYLDLARAYAANVDNQVINGTGASNQVLGILNTGGINAAAAFGAALTVTNFTLKVAGQIAAVTQQGAGIWPKCIVMHPRRWGWATGTVDSSGRPVVLASPMGAFNALGVIDPEKAGMYGGDPDPVSGATFIGMHSSGLPVITDSNIPINVGTLSEDVILVLDTQEMHLWEDGDGAPKQLSFEQTAGPNLTTTLVVYNYAAFTAGRYPGATGKVGGLDTVGGNGLVAPTF